MLNCWSLIMGFSVILWDFVIFRGEFCCKDDLCVFYAIMKGYFARGTDYTNRVICINNTQIAGNGSSELNL